jgi:hypothetical protein
VASRRSRSLSQASSKSYITKEILGKEEEEFKVLLCFQLQRYPSSQPKFSEPSLTKELQGEARRKEAKGGCIFIKLRYELTCILYVSLIDHLVFPHECLSFMHKYSYLVYIVIDQVRSKLDLGF